MIETIIKPGKVIKKLEFTSYPPFSIAIDGYVFGSPFFNRSGPHLNLNHHEEVERLPTRSTCAQMQIYIKQGLFRLFRQNGEPHATIYCNDCDQDVSLTNWLAINHGRIDGVRSEPLINKLLFAEDLLDATAGAYPFPLDSDLMRDIAWIFQPYTSVVNKIQGMTEHEMRNVIESNCRRIDAYTLGKGDKLEPNAELEMLYQGEDWAMIKEKGFFARTKLFNSGTYAFISYRGESNGGHRFSLGKMSPLIDVPLEEMYSHYNELEGISPDDTDRWGGGDTTGGSPRIKGSKMAPHQLASATVEFLRNRKR